MKKKVAVVILNWNGKEYLEKFLKTVVAYTPDSLGEVVVIDNNSGDESVSYIQDNFPSVNLIVLKENHGFANGYNQGLKEIDAEYFVLLNSDVEVTEGWLEPVLLLLDSEQDIACAMPKLKAYHEKDKFEYAGAAGGFIDKYGYPFCRGRIFDCLEKDEGQYNTQADIFWATGAAMFVRADDYFEAGGLDGDFFAHMEEIDLCWRLKNMGKRIVYCPDAEVYHVGGGTLPKENPFKTYLNFRNNLYLLYKNLASKGFIRIFLLRMVLDGVAGFRFLLMFDLKNFYAIIKAHIHFYRSLSWLRAKRKICKSMSVNYQHPQILDHSIVFAYFIRKKKSYTAL